MKRLFGKPDDEPSKEELERQAADELAAAGRPSQWGAPAQNQPPAGAPATEIPPPRSWAIPTQDERPSSGGAPGESSSAGEGAPGGSPSSWGTLGRAAMIPPTGAPRDASTPAPGAAEAAGPLGGTEPPPFPPQMSGPAAGHGPDAGQSGAPHPGATRGGMAPFFTPQSGATAEGMTPAAEEEAITEIALRDLAGRSGSSPEEVAYIHTDAERAAAARDRALQEFLERKAERDRRRSQQDG